MEALSLHKNRLAALPPSLSKLRDLTRLSLYENELTEVPAGLGELENVQEM
jgi:Leucine-rich repeat (LRR) protein